MLFIFFSFFSNNLILQVEIAYLAFFINTKINIGKSRQLKLKLNLKMF